MKKFEKGNNLYLDVIGMLYKNIVLVGNGF